MGFRLHQSDDLVKLMWSLLGEYDDSISELGSIFDGAFGEGQWMYDITDYDLHDRNPVGSIVDAINFCKGVDDLTYCVVEEDEDVGPYFIFMFKSLTPEEVVDRITAARVLES